MALKKEQTQDSSTTSAKSDIDPDIFELMDDIGELLDYFKSINQSETVRHHIDTLLTEIDAIKTKTELQAFNHNSLSPFFDAMYQSLDNRIKFLEQKNEITEAEKFEKIERSIGAIEADILEIIPKTKTTDELEHMEYEINRILCDSVINRIASEPKDQKDETWVNMIVSLKELKRDKRLIFGNFNDELQGALLKQDSSTFFSHVDKALNHLIQSYDLEALGGMHDIDELMDDIDEVLNLIKSNNQNTEVKMQVDQLRSDLDRIETPDKLIYFSENQLIPFIDSMIEFINKRINALESNGELDAAEKFKHLESLIIEVETDLYEELKMERNTKIETIFDEINNLLCEAALTKLTAKDQNIADCLKILKTSKRLLFNDFNDELQKALALTDYDAFANKVKNDLQHLITTHHLTFLEATLNPTRKVELFSDTRGKAASRASLSNIEATIPTEPTSPASPSSRKSSADLHKKSLPDSPTNESAPMTHRKSIK